MICQEGDFQASIPQQCSNAASLLGAASLIDAASLLDADSRLNNASSNVWGGKIFP